MHDTGTVNPDTQKPDIVEFYNSTKGGVDVFDKLCHSYSTKRGTRRWPMRYFYGVLDAAGINAFVLHRLNNNAVTQVSRSDFLKSLAFSLAKPFMELRVTNARLPRNLRTEIRAVLGIPEPAESTPPPTHRGQPETRKRCYLCIDRKTYNSCETCALPICRQHEKTKRLCFRCEPEKEY